MIYEAGQETTPMGPGFFIFFNDPLNVKKTGAGTGGAAVEYEDETLELVQILTYFLEAAEC